eukprot:2675601-Rhodomonas_salina.1
MVLRFFVCLVAMSTTINAFGHVSSCWLLSKQQTQSKANQLAFAKTSLPKRSFSAPLLSSATNNAGGGREDDYAGICRFEHTDFVAENIFVFASLEMLALQAEASVAGMPARRLGYAAFFDRVFEDSDVHPMYASPQIDRDQYIDALAQSHMAIIDEPAERLQLPLLSFKTENEVAKVMFFTAQKASPRNKPVLAVVRGTGGGKTRALEELRFGLLRQRGLLALAYTYNSGMEISADDSAWAEDSSLSKAKQARVCYPFTVVARLAC